MSDEEARLPAALLFVENSKVYSFDKPVIRIGRASENDLVVAHAKVSRKHAEIRYKDGRFQIHDLGSKGGTYVNGELIETAELNKGDVITLAGVHIVFGQDHFPVATSTSKYTPPKPDEKFSKESTIVRRDWKQDE
jgi:pSer/pThr/pTyr-binding forkhead associated (FHA) protein